MHLSSILMKTLGVILLLGVCTGLNGQFSITTVNSDHTINFNSYDGSVLSPTSPGITSNDWAMAGLKEADIAFGGTGDGKDFKGESDGSDVGGKGIYAFETSTNDFSLGVRPKGDFLSPGSFTLRVQNNTGQTIETLSVGYDIFIYNSENATNSFDFSHSADNVSYNPLVPLDFDSPSSKDGSPSWVQTSKSTDLTGLSIANGGVYYLRWTGDTAATGKAHGDLMGLDNVVLNASAIPEPTTIAFIFGAIAFIAVAIKRRASQRSD